MKKTLVIMVILTLALACAAPQTKTEEGTRKGAVIGAIGGAVVGGIIGGDSKGALIGAGVGALAGGAIGRSYGKKMDEQEAAMRRQLAALEEAKTTLKKIDAIAVTQSPGLIGSLLVGLSFARALSYASDKPLVEIDHIKSHIYANFLDAFQNLNTTKSYHIKIGNDQVKCKCRGIFGVLLMIPRLKESHSFVTIDRHFYIETFFFQSRSDCFKNDFFINHHVFNQHDNTECPFADLADDLIAIFDYITGLQAGSVNDLWIAGGNRGDIVC